MGFSGMKGIIFNLLEEVVTTHIDEEAWDAMLESAGADGAYTSLGNYPDDQFVALLEALSRRTGKAGRDALPWFGRLSMPMLAKRYPEFFTTHRRLRPFLLSLNVVIHSEVRKLYPGADVPVFEFETPPSTDGNDALIIHYRSGRRLCLLAEGFIHGAAELFGERVQVRQLRCMLNGDDECALLCSFQKGP